MPSLSSMAYTALRTAGAGPAGASLGTLYVSITAETIGLARGMKQAEQTLEASTARMAATATAAGAAIAAVFVGIAAIGVKEYAKFEHEMTKASAIFGDVNKETRKELETTARALARDTNVSAVDLAKGYQTLASAGLSAQEAQQALGITTKFATAGFIEASKSVDYLVGAQTALGFRTGDVNQDLANMTRISDVLVKANALAKGTVDDFAASLSNKGALAIKMANKQVEEGVAVLGVLADRNITGKHAGEQLYIAMRDLQRVGIENNTAFQKYNVTIFDSTGQMRHMADIISDLEKALSGMGTAQKRTALEQMGFQDRSMAAILALVGLSDKIREYEKGLQAASGTTEKMNDEVLGSFINQLTITWNRIKDLFITVGEYLTPALREINKLFQEMADPNTGLGAVVKPIMEFLGAHLTDTIKTSIAWFKLLLDQSLKMAQLMLRGFSLVINTVASLIEGQTNAVISGVNLAIRTVNRLIDSLPDWIVKKTGITKVNEISWKLDINTGVIDQIDAKLEKMRLGLEGKLPKIPQAVEKATTAAKTKIDDLSESLDMVAEHSRIVAQQMDRLEIPKGAIDVLTGRPRAMTKAEMGVALGFQGDTGQMLQNAREQELAQERLDFLKKVSDSEVALNEETQARKAQAMEFYHRKMQMLQYAQAQMILGTSSQMFTDMATITEVFAGKQSDAYKAMFAASKAFAVAEATVKIFQGIAEAAALPWPLNLGAIASVVAATATIVSSIQSVQLEFAGARAAGGPVRGGKAYLVGERGPEMFVPPAAGNIIANSRLGDGTPKIVINNFTDVNPEVTVKDDGGERTVEIVLRRVKSDIGSEIREGRGPITKALESTYKLRRGV